MTNTAIHTTKLGSRTGKTPQRSLYQMNSQLMLHAAVERATHVVSPALTRKHTDTPMHMCKRRNPSAAAGLPAQSADHPRDLPNPQPSTTPQAQTLRVHSLPSAYRPVQASPVLAASTARYTSMCVP
jgi:hypothetical protein